ncbi:putative intraflagellar transport protein [Apostichopus japonicus]|uniref:Heat shock protein Beta 11.2 n=1 Tax=Stichopus japonicus TaxID=307972 RepID=A0A2G8JKK2_STIJA|nr:putative intraflagellar transport protein [Apostichopus japonicus]PIK40808.1 putative intraflagellar transport protein [Apostichopus japonicus]QCY50081.1 heat shock protein Beta 11.2 [Apostichopus japonicus]
MDVATAESGAQILLATSSDSGNPPENMIDGRLDTFWASTGLYPQEFILSFTTLVNLKTIKVNSFQVKGLKIERSVQQEPTDFETLKDAELSPSDASLQTEEYKVDSSTAKHLRFIITSGYDHFFSVHRLSVEGSPVS